MAVNVEKGDEIELDDTRRRLARAADRGADGETVGFAPTGWAGSVSRSVAGALHRRRGMNSRVLVLASCLLLGPVHAGEPGESGNLKPRQADLVLPTPDYLPPLARQLLRKRMERHGRDLSRLVLAVTVLQRDVVKSIAGDIATEPRISRPLAEGRDDLNAALPERFFVLQDALQT